MYKMFETKKRLFGNKKGDNMLMTLSLFMLFSLIAGLMSYSMFKQWSEREKSTIDPALYIGEKQINLILTSNRAEQDLFYLDQSVKYSAAQSFLSLAEKSGFADDSPCGKYLDYNILKDQEKTCDPLDNFDDNFRAQINSIIYKYSIAYNRDMPARFDYSVIDTGDKLKVIGTTDSDMEYDIGRNKGAGMSGKTSNLCNYCNLIADEVRDQDGYECSGSCCRGPCPEDALMNGVPLVPFINQCGDSDVKEYEVSCDTDEVGTLCSSGCGPTAMNMVLEYYGVPADNWFFFNKNGDGTCFSKDGYDPDTLQKFAESKNLVAEVSHDVAWDDLIYAVSQGPVLLLQNQELAGLCEEDIDVLDRTYCTGGHYLVILYAGENYVIANDPYTKGASNDVGNNIILSRDLLEPAWQKRGGIIIKIKGRVFDPDFDPYKGVLLENENNNWVSYYPLDSMKQSHLNVINLFGMTRCGNSGNDLEFFPGLMLGSDVGDNIYAVSGGRVIRAGEESLTYEGAEIDEKYAQANIIEIDHNNGFVSRYYFAENIFVEPGEIILSGRRIAEAGVFPGTDIGAFYFEIHKDGSDNEKIMGSRCYDWVVGPVKKAVDPLEFYYDAEFRRFTPEIIFSKNAIDNSDIEDLSSREYYESAIENILEIG